MSQFIINPYTNPVAAGWNIDDDFTSYADDAAFAVVYPTASVSTAYGDASGNNIQILFKVTTTPQSLVRDYGSTISDTAWITRFRYNLTAKTLDPVGYDVPNTFGWTTLDQSSDSDVNCDGIGLCSYQDNLPRFYFSAYADNTHFDGQVGHGNYGTIFATTPTAGDDYYVQEVRDSATQTTIGLYTDEYSTLHEEEITTIPSTVQNLRYFACKAAGYANNVGLQYGNVHTYLRFADGVTTPP